MRLIYQHVIRARLTPFEDQPPLLIDSDVRCILVELQIVAKRHPHESQRHCRIQLCQLAHCHILDVGKSGAFALREQQVGIRASERLDGHRLILYRLPVIGNKKQRFRVGNKRPARAPVTFWKIARLQLEKAAVPVNGVTTFLAFSYQAESLERVMNFPLPSAAARPWAA
jgi:hypothetical protein